MTNLDTQPRDVGSHIREWRQRRRMTQLDLALEAEISARHLSFLETGKAQPSRDMVLNLCDRLDVPLRERNTLLLAAGFAPVFPQRPLNDPVVKHAREAIELIEGAGFLFADRPIALDDKANALLDTEARQRLAAMLPRLEAAAHWQAADLEEIVRAYAEESGAKLGKVAQPLRAALTGKAVSPPVFDVMAVLGREEALGRIRDQAA